jgi:hypothetical protein
MFYIGEIHVGIITPGFEAEKLGGWCYVSSEGQDWEIL